MKVMRIMLLSVLLVALTITPVLAGVGRAEDYRYQSSQSLTTATVEPVYWRHHYWHGYYGPRYYGYYRPYYDPYYDPYYYGPYHYGPGVSVGVPGFSLNFGY